MKKIFLSIAVIATVAAIVVGATTAYFSDTETSTGNTFSAGTIDIAVDGENPWQSTDQYNLVDMKPSQVGYISFTINNVGSNPANVWKDLTYGEPSDNGVNEPECVYGGGVWEGNVCTGNYIAQNNIDEVITYDLSVEVFEPEGQEPVWWQTIYTGLSSETLSEIYGENEQGVLLGMIPAGWRMEVTQSYHMDAETGNWAQSDMMTFDMELYAEQLAGTVWMENKDFANANNPTIVHNDLIEGTLKYTVKAATFIYEFDGRAPLANTSYTLLFYPETWSDPSLNAPAWPRDIINLGNNISDGDGDLTISGSQNFEYDILNMKVWLVKTSDLTGNQMTGWTNNGEDTLYELGLMDYYDSLI